MDPTTSRTPSSGCASGPGSVMWHPHELRHSGASLELAQGTPLHVVSGFSGTPVSRSPRTCTGICSKGRTGAAELDEPGSVRAEMLAWLPRCSQNNQKSPPAGRQGPVSWARSEDSNPNLLIRSKVKLVQGRPALSISSR